jgi:hypothetical protein
MADKIDLKDTIDYNKTIIIRQADTKPHKSLVLYMKGGNNLLSGPTMSLSYRILDSLGKIRYSGDHFHLAVQAYNKLYNE